MQEYLDQLKHVSFVDTNQRNLVENLIRLSFQKGKVEAMQEANSLIKNAKIS